MPVSGLGENSIGCWRALVFVILLIICAALVPWASGTKNPTPTPITGASPTAFSPGTPSLTSEPLPPDGKYQVSVVDISGEPIENVVLSISDSNYKAYSADGKFEVNGSDCLPERFIFASAPEFLIGAKPCSPRPYPQPYQISLTSLNSPNPIDNPNYQWSPANGDCSQCHLDSTVSNFTASPSYDEFDEWSRSGHARIFDRAYFRSMYNGTTLAGKPSVPARPIILGNEWVPVPAEISQDYHGPGFRLDSPQEPGNCAFCHAPAMIQASQTGTYLDTLPGGVFAEGVTCDVCHKVFDVVLADNGFPFTDQPGILSFRFLRPPSNEKFLTGPFANLIRTGLKGSVIAASVPNHRSTCVPRFSQSEFCAPCHFGKFGDMVIYNSYGEWKASGYGANPGDGAYRTCQDCHMSYLDELSPRASLSQRQACGGAVASLQNFNHNMMNVGVDNIPYMVKRAAAIKIEIAKQTGKNTLDFTVNVTNTEAGHKFPTDSPLRHLILVVEARDRLGTPLILVGGDRIPNWAGPGPATSREYALRLENKGVKDYGGFPGEVFANLLVEEETNLSPGMAYWNETKLASSNSDTRLWPHTPDPSFYSFAMPDAGDVTINVKLMYRFAFFDLMAWQEWLPSSDLDSFERADILVSEWQCEGAPTQPEALQQSCKPIGP